MLKLESLQVCLHPDSDPLGLDSVNRAGHPVDLKFRTVILLCVWSVCIYVCCLSIGRVCVCLFVGNQ